MKDLIVCFDDVLLGRAYAMMLGEETPIGWCFEITGIYTWPDSELVEEEHWDPIIERNQETIGGLTVEWVDRQLRT